MLAGQHTIIDRLQHHSMVLQSETNRLADVIYIDLSSQQLLSGDGSLVVGQMIPATMLSAEFVRVLTMCMTSFLRICRNMNTSSDV